MTNLVEAYSRRLLAFHEPSPEVDRIEEFFNHNHDPKDGRFTSGSGSAGGKMWTGVSALPDKRTRPTPGTLPTTDAGARTLAKRIYEADLGNGYRSHVDTDETAMTEDGAIYVKGTILFNGRQRGTFERFLHKDSSGAIIASHDLLMIDAHHRGMGIADRFNAHAIAEYQKLGVDHITLIAGDDKLSVGAYAWARQGFRYGGTGDGARRAYLTRQLDRIDNQLLKPVLRPYASQVRQEVKALKRAIEAGEDVQPIHVASIGEKYARHTARDDDKIEYTTWPGKSVLLGTKWPGVYYFDAAHPVVASATDLAHVHLRPRFRTEIEEFYNVNHDPHSGKFTYANGSVSMIRGDIRRERLAISQELDKQGLDEMNPLRHIFESSMGNSVAVIRNAAGEVVGGVQFDVDKAGREVTVTDMRVLPKNEGHGTKAFEAIAKIAVHNDYDLNVYGAIQSAKPFYSKLGAHFQHGHSTGDWTDEGRDALAAGKPISGAEHNYTDWSKLPLWAASQRPRKRAQVASAEELACHDASCAPPPAGTGGSLQARRGVVPGYGPTRRRDIMLGSVRVTYHPEYPDDHPDPGEVVWAKVRFSENTALSKDRPVLVIGRINGTDKLAAVQLSSQVKGRPNELVIPAGKWGLAKNGAVKLDQIIVVDPKDYRREGSALSKSDFESVIGRLAAYHRTPVQIAAAAHVEAFYNHRHDPRTGKFASSGGSFKVITKAEARGDSRPVSHAEFQRLASIGQKQLDKFEADASGIEKFNENWTTIKREAYQEVRKSWGGATIDSHTGEALPQGANAYAITVKHQGLKTVSVHEHATEEEFNAAMDKARTRFGSILMRQQHHLGVFHDDENHRIDIDPVLVVTKREDVDTIGAASHSIGGAYNFADGNGYWPPHVAEA